MNQFFRQKTEFTSDKLKVEKTEQIFNTYQCFLEEQTPFFFLLSFLSSSAIKNQNEGVKEIKSGGNS